MFGLNFHRPLWFGEIPGLTHHYLVLEQHSGKIQLISPSADGYKKSLFLKVDVHSSNNEMGLLGMTFHPNFAQNRKYYVYFNPSGNRSFLGQYLADADLKKDSGNEPVPIMGIDQPRWNHNGGGMSFGPDGYLYFSLGDGGGSGDPEKNGQNPHTLLGAILRLDVDNAMDDTTHYSIPETNPYVNGDGGTPEVFAWGLRNTWRFSFDPLDGTIYGGDVGQIKREEINIIQKGMNYGWNRTEGLICYQSDCDFSGTAKPIVDFDRGDAKSITGGRVFRANPESEFYGVYFFADYQTKNAWALKVDENNELNELVSLPKTPAKVSSFGTDHAGNLYLVGHNNGKIYRMDHPDLMVDSSSLSIRSNIREKAASARYYFLPHEIQQLLPPIWRGKRMGVNGKKIPKKW